MGKTLHSNLTALFLISILNTTHAEGSYELLNGSCSNWGFIQIWDNNSSARNFATYGCPSTSRLNIRLLNGDHIYFGYSTDVEDVYYRIKDPNGNTVKGPTLITSSSTRGWISTCNKVMTGPDSLYSGGYKCLGFPVHTTGDWYIEFAVNNSATTYSKRVFSRFDITVVSSGVVKKGRVWSQKWDLNTSGSTRAFSGNLYCYTLDSVVTKINFNGIKPAGFMVSCNSYGATDIGSYTAQRKSDYQTSIINAGGTPAVPEYRIFLNDPDSTQFPTGSVGHVTGVVLETCGQDTNCIDVTVTKAGQVEITLVFPNGTSKTLVQTVTAGSNCIVWDGTNGLGNVVGAGATIQIQTNYLRGMTHLPMIDVEDHPNGFIITLVRPSKDWNNNNFPAPTLFWNDSLLSDPSNSLDGVSNMSGCSGGCHKWQSRGTNNSNPEVINTWWYISQQKDTTIQYCPSVLALELTHFSGVNFFENNLVQWETGSEPELHHFQLQRSTDSVHFKAIENIIARGSDARYYFTDDIANENAYRFYYRLKMISQSGSHIYSEIIVVEKQVSHTPFVSIYPNPGNGREFHITCSGITDEEIMVNVVNLHGEVVAHFKVQKNNNGLFDESLVPDKSLRPGFYMLNIISARENISKGLMIR